MMRLTQRPRYNLHQVSKERQKNSHVTMFKHIASLRNLNVMFLLFVFGFMSTIVQASSTFSKNSEISLWNMQTLQRPCAHKFMNRYSLKYDFRKVRQNKFHSSLELFGSDLNCCNTQKHLKSIVSSIENLRGGSSGRNGNDGGYYDYRDDSYYRDQREETSNSRYNYDYDDNEYRSQSFDDRRGYHEDDYYEKRPDSRPNPVSSFNLFLFNIIFFIVAHNYRITL